MHTFRKEAKWKQSKNGRPTPGITDWPADGILYLVLWAFWSILFQQKCAYLDTSGFQEVLPWESFSTINIDSLNIDYRRNNETFANRFFSEERYLDVSLGPYWETSVSKITPPPPLKNRFLFGLGTPIWDMLLSFQDDWSTTLSIRMDLL